MLEKKYKNIVYFITLAVMATIGAQVYWNVKNYEVNKQQVTNQIQLSFDSAVEKYYSGIVKNDVFTILNSKSSTDKKNPYKKTRIVQILSDSLNPNSTQKAESFADSIQISIINPPNQNNLNIFTSSKDSLFIHDFTSKILLSFQDSSIDLKKLDSLLITELDRKKINIPYGIKYKTSTFLSDKIEIKKYKLEKFSKNYLSTTSNSSFLPRDSKLELLYTNTAPTILKRMLGSILLSLLLSIIIIGCLLFLLRIIFKQKQLSEVKNDLISNITHEFKTPIATIGVALESIKDFNVIENIDKTKNYIDISNNQLDKLNVMVEKLLETASLNSDNLNLQKATTNIVQLVQTVIENHQMQTVQKNIVFNTSFKSIIAKVDTFHFENAINNIIDNAIKYGGNNISIQLNQQENNFTILISDDGYSLKKSHKEQIFEQFYRVPTGNTHDIKGFGIGLYYAKKIIEKHGGNIDLELNNNAPTFIISLPNE